MTPDQPTRLRLGSYHLDLRTGELSLPENGERGRRTLLQEQPFRVLRILIERTGEIATRDEIRKTLWPNDTIVDFDHSINVAIGTLRRAFGDSAAQPMYIETVARRGYRLLVQPEPLAAIDEPSREPEVSTPALTTAAGSLIGRKVSHFRVLEVIGGGGMGMVYKAEDLKLGRQVALKFLPEEMATDTVALKRFEREAQTASSLNHANICTIFEIDEHEGQPMLVMELLEGATLRDCLVPFESGGMPVEQLLPIAKQTCDGLQVAHSQGIIHRDIKPANIYLSTEGAVKILDFGLAKLVEGQDLGDGQAAQSPLASRTADLSLVAPGGAMGTASYMSPEQIRKEKLDARTDLFSLGLVLYEMATGQRAFPGDNATGIHHALLNKQPPPVRELNPAVPPALEAIIAKALQKDRDNRYPTAKEMRKALDDVPTPRQLRLRRIRQWLAIAAVVLLASAASWSYWRYLTRYQLTANDTIVIADLSNHTSDPVLDDALNLALPVELAQTPFLQVLAQDKVRESMKQLQHPQDGKVTTEIAREVCRKTNSKAVVTSSIADVGNHFRILLSGINCQSGNTFAESRRDVALRKDIVHALGLAGVELRGRMGEPASSLRSYDVPLEQATSSSPEALQLLAKGFRNHFSPDKASVTSYYERAIDIDPDFALAYASVGIIYLSQGRVGEAVAAEKRAYDLRDRLTGQLRFLAVTLYYSVGLGDQEKAYPIYRQWIQTFPLDGVAHNNYAGAALSLGKYNESAAAAREAIRLMPSLAGGNYTTLMIATTKADRLDEAKIIFAEAQARNFDEFPLHASRHLIAFLQHDEPAMKEQLAWAETHDAWQLFSQAADARIYSGRFEDAVQWMDKARKAAVKARSKSAVALFNLDTALWQSEVGRTADARLSLIAAIPVVNGRDDRLGLALALARSGEPAQAATLVDEIDRASPSDTLVQKFSLPTIRAAIRLHEGDAQGAVDILRPVEEYDLIFSRSFDWIYPAYLRGLAYLRLGQGGPAAAQFRKLLDHPALVGQSVTGVLARLQLGRAQVLLGDKPAARKSYQEFLSLWKDADPGIPVLDTAKAEYAVLR
ncbi:protein kinase domain-containing protein [Paludibaculum fermentans]|uniref:non-specific serine/threonine protein kinase n=1 Tax=Paludibaculum fermentans TaxID=1473598 RepID=A0A7S7SIB4_PALFE|nr:protein kinase [Paludibaculum fermentans]QOY85899.1 protein kinase [Paludibaculum fermentans]